MGVAVTLPVNQPVPAWYVVTLKCPRPVNKCELPIGLAASRDINVNQLTEDWSRVNSYWSRSFYTPQNRLYNESDVQNNVPQAATEGIYTHFEYVFFVEKDPHISRHLTKPCKIKSYTLEIV